MEERVQNIKNESLAQIMNAKDLEEIENLRITYLGRKGELSTLTQKLAELEPKDRGAAGRVINDVKQAIENALLEKKQELKTGRIQGTFFDPTVPGIEPSQGHLHLITQAIEEISNIFEKTGFVRVRYPEVEWNWFVFEALNMPEGHPARDEWETFFVDVPPHPKYGNMVLTPHTSSGQLRETQRVKTPPIRMINIGKTYRRQSDVSHVPMFHQFEGLIIDKGISITNLKGTLDYFACTFFGPERRTRLRPYHFQFTEPSFEVDVSCGVCKGKGCKLCKAGWLELGGAGMVHPNVLKHGGINPKEYTGFAFGWGVERTFMMKSDLNLPDVRLLYGSDLRFLRQF